VCITHDVDVATGIVVESDVLSFVKSLASVGFSRNLTATDLQDAHTRLVSRLIEVFLPLLVADQLRKRNVLREIPVVKPVLGKKNQPPEGANKCGEESLHLLPPICFHTIMIVMPSQLFFIRQSESQALYFHRSMAIQLRYLVPVAAAIY
jgi:hypothetical protein